MRTASELEIPRLYHYQSFRGESTEHLRDTLTNNRIYCSNPSHFNDPWDCSPLFVMGPIVTPESVDRWTAILMPNLDQILTQAQIAAIQNLDLKQYIAFLEETIKNLTKSSTEITASRWRVYCLSSEPTVELIWAHYADKHQGVCLEFDASVQLVGRSRKVKYTKDRPHITWKTYTDLMKLTEAILLTKSEQWAYEQEFRILARCGEEDKAPTETLGKTYNNYLSLPPGAITRVIVGARGDLGAVKKLVHGCNPDIEVCQARLSQGAYKVII